MNRKSGRKEVVTLFISSATREQSIKKKTELVCGFFEFESLFSLSINLFFNFQCVHPMPKQNNFISLPKLDGDILDQARMAAVVDTNYFIDSLSLIQSLSKLALAEQVVIIVPWIVVQELDNLQKSTRISKKRGQPQPLIPQVEVGELARQAVRFLDGGLGKPNSAIRCQKRSEFVNLEETVNDDKILDCCLFMNQEKRLPVVILTRDRNLSVKARANGCATCGDWSKGADELLVAILGSGGFTAKFPNRSETAARPIRALKNGVKAAAAEQLPTIFGSTEPGEVVSQNPKRKRAKKNKTPTTIPVAAAASNSFSRRNTSNQYFHFGASKKVRCNLQPPSSPTHTSSPLESLFGNNSGGNGSSGLFTFSMPAPSVSIASATKYNDNGSGFIFSNPLPGAPIVVSDSDDNNDESCAMDIDMSEDSDLEVIEQNISSLLSPTPPPVASLIEEPKDDPDAPVVIYLDASPEKYKLAEHAGQQQRPPNHISIEIIKYMCNATDCGLVTLIERHLKKVVSTDGQRHFQAAPWGSATTIFTIILLYWSDVFSKIFPKNLEVSIRCVIPWIMHVEGVQRCPLLVKPLPKRLSFTPFKHSASSETGSATTSDAVSRFGIEGKRTMERREETSKLVLLAKRLLAQCELVETDAQGQIRRKMVEGWMVWQKSNKQQM